MNLLNIGTRGSFPPLLPLHSPQASALAWWSPRKGPQPETEKFFLASIVLQGLVPF